MFKQFIAIINKRTVIRYAATQSRKATINKKLK